MICMRSFQCFAVGTFRVSTGRSTRCFILHLSGRSCCSHHASHALTLWNCLFSLNLLCGLVDVFPAACQHKCTFLYVDIQSPARCNVQVHRGRCNTASTYFTKLSSSLLLALIAGVLGSSVFLPPLVARKAPPIVTPRVAIASYKWSLSVQFISS